MEVHQTKQELRKIVQNEKNKADGVEIIFYTDPLCCWSWAFEPQWRRLQYQFQNQIVFRYVMTGLLPSWKNYSDPLYSVSRPQQMGPVWMEASSTSGMPINSKIWVEGAPSSSYPACIAFKAMQLQSESAAIKYLRLLRQAVMVKGKNIAKQSVLIQIAEDVATEYPADIDVPKFASDLTNDNGLEAFRVDWQETQSKNIMRTPTLIMRGQNNAAVIITGYRPYLSLIGAIMQISPCIEPTISKICKEEYIQFWGNLMAREIEEIL